MDTKSNLKGYKEVLYDFLAMLFPFELEDNEYISMLRIELPKEGAKDRKASRLWAQSFDEVFAHVKKFKDWNDMYIGLSTNKGNENRESPYRRAVIGIDYDKGMMQNKDARFTDICKQFKACGHSYHMAVDSGHGYHFYFGIVPTKDIELCAKVTKKISLSQAGADSRVALTTQLMRLPTTFNIKEIAEKLKNCEEYSIKESSALRKRVRVITNSIHDDVFKRYDLEKMYPAISPDELDPDNAFGNGEPPFESGHPKKDYSYKGFACVEEMLKGVVETQRNYVMGRLVGYYRHVQGLCDDDIEVILFKWNEKNQPPKPKNEWDREIRGYLNGDCDFLSCKHTNDRFEAIREIYCKKCYNGGDWFVRIPKKYLTNEMLLEVSGYEYFILMMLLRRNDWISMADLLQDMIIERTNKPRLSKATVSGILSHLVSLGMVEASAAKINKNTLFKAEQKNDCDDEGRPIYVNVVLGLAKYYIKRMVTPTDIIIYLYLRRNVYNRNDTLQLVMQEKLGIGSTKYLKTHCPYEQYGDFENKG